MSTRYVAAIVVVLRVMPGLPEAPLQMIFFELEFLSPSYDAMDYRFVCRCIQLPLELAGGTDGTMVGING